MRWASILVVPEGERPHPRHTYGRGVGLEDAADHYAIGHAHGVLGILGARIFAQSQCFNGLAARSPLTNGARRKHFAMRSPPFAGIAQRHEPTPR
jgi:hypothetical protein